MLGLGSLGRANFRFDEARLRLLVLRLLVFLREEVERRELVPPRVLLGLLLLLLLRLLLDFRFVIAQMFLSLV